MLPHGNGQLKPGAAQKPRSLYKELRQPKPQAAMARPTVIFTLRTPHKKNFHMAFNAGVKLVVLYS